MSQAAYRLADAAQVYAGREVLRVAALDIPAGRITGIAGPNGSGKSTLLRILAFLEAPVSGRMSFFGAPCGFEDEALRRQATLLTQEPYLLRRSVAGNVAYGLKVRGLGAGEAVVGAALEMVGLAPERFARRNWFELSGGEAQRVALAARLVLRPRVLLLDEPTASLDEDSARRIREAALAAREQWGATVVAVSHDMAWLHSLADSVVFMRGGQVVGPAPGSGGGCGSAPADAGGRTGAAE